LRQAMEHGQLTPAEARFYLAINLHNYDQKYQDALELIIPLVEKYPDNAIFRLARGDLYAKLGRKELAIADYRAAQGRPMANAECKRKIELLAGEALQAQGAEGQSSIR